MIPEELQKLIDSGEGITVEFKESHTEITRDVYETVCSFSNRDGGHIFLGVNGALSLATFEPFSKNPPISKVFREIGMADELGSGMRNTYKYTKMYSGTNPQFVEGDVFRITIPLTEVATATVGPGLSEVPNGAINGAIKLTGSEQRVFEAILQNPHITRKELTVLLGLGEGTVYRAIQKLKAEGAIERIGSNKAGYWKINHS